MINERETLKGPAAERLMSRDLKRDNWSRTKFATRNDVPETRLFISVRQLVFVVFLV